MGQPVWYQNERYYVEWVPPDWKRSVGVRISSARIPEGATHDSVMRLAVHERLPDTRHSFFVTADCLELARPVRVRTELAGRVPTKSAEERRKSGAQDVGDEAAQLLRGSDDIYAAASKFLGVEAKDLRAKYAHLNPGQQRMNLGNRMRAYQRKGQT